MNTKRNGTKNNLWKLHTMLCIKIGFAMVQMICFWFASRGSSKFHLIPTFIWNEWTICIIYFNSDSIVYKGTFQKWDNWYVHSPIEAYNHHKHLFNTKRVKVTKKQVLEKIAEYFNATADVTISGNQCLWKWTKLEQ